MTSRHTLASCLTAALSARLVLCRRKQECNHSVSRLKPEVTIYCLGPCAQAKPRCSVSQETHECDSTHLQMTNHKAGRGLGRQLSHGAWMEARGQLAGISSILPPCGSRGLKPGRQAWRQASSAAKPSHWPCFPFSSFCFFIIYVHSLVNIPHNIPLCYLSFYCSKSR